MNTNYTHMYLNKFETSNKIKRNNNSKVFQRFKNKQKNRIKLKNKVKIFQKANNKSKKKKENLEKNFKVK